MGQDFLQLMSPGEMRRSGDAWRGLDHRLSDLDRILQGASRSSSSSDRTTDRMVPQVFAARITASSSQVAISGTRHWWLYDWKEVERDATAPQTWNDVAFGRKSYDTMTAQIYNDYAINAYETSIDDDGGNLIPSTPVRLPYPTGSVVEMIIDPAGRAWFDKPNPVEIC
jgi:hypothetical protein